MAPVLTYFAINQEMGFAKPIMIATMGWGLDAGAIAAAVSVAGLTLIAEPLSGLLFA